mmetsp:Transcript_98613/g.174680  ORF Transcript_98613/g.174680 Transcript_98613/m.174680 type:complete len:91 (+) Transcript_98613:126-398(+)
MDCRGYQSPHGVMARRHFGELRAQLHQAALRLHHRETLIVQETVSEAAATLRDEAPPRHVARRAVLMAAAPPVGVSAARSFHRLSHPAPL